MGEIALLNERVRPHGLQEGVCLDDSAGILHENDQGVENLRRQRNDRPVAEEQTGCGIQLVGTKLIKSPSSQRSNHGFKLLKEIFSVPSRLPCQPPLRLRI